MSDNLECLKTQSLSGPICAKLKEFYCTAINAFYQQYYKALKCLVQAALLAVMKKGFILFHKYSQHHSTMQLLTGSEQLSDNLKTRF